MSLKTINSLQGDLFLHRNGAMGQVPYFLTSYHSFFNLLQLSVMGCNEVGNVTVELKANFIALLLIHQKS